MKRKNEWNHIISYRFPPNTTVGDPVLVLPLVLSNHEWDIFAMNQLQSRFLHIHTNIHNYIYYIYTVNQYF